MALQKLWKMIFISSEKIFRSGDIRIFIMFFPVPFLTFQI